MTPTPPPQTTTPTLATSRTRTGPGSAHPSGRPQRLHTWFNLIPVAEYERSTPREVLFLDTYVTIEATPRGDTPYRVRFEGEHEMTVVVDVGLIFVWYGDDLGVPDRPFPTFFDQQYPSAYVSSPSSVFDNTHVMDFVENGSDNLHFTAVHLWEHSRIFDHEVGPERITLKQDTRFRYGKCSTKRHIRLLSRVLPELELTQDYVYHGPGLAVVGAEGRGTPDMHALVSLTPEGPDRTRVHVTIALSPDTFPQWAERVSATVTGGALCDRLAGVMAGYIQNEFDIDAIVWANRRYSRHPALLPSERHLADVIRWGETFYPPDFEFPEPQDDAADPSRWRALDRLDRLDTQQLRRYEIDGTHLVAHLGPTREPLVFPAFCPHQGAHLGYGGTVDRGCVRCPFHGFHFDRDGRCIGRNPDKRTPIGDGLTLDPVAHRVVDGWVEVLV